MVFCDWPFSFGMFSQFIRVITCINAFLFMDIQYCVIVPHFVSVHKLMDSWVVCTFWLQWTILWTFEYMFLYGHLFSFFLDICLVVELVGQIVTLGVTFWGTAILFSKEFVPFLGPFSSIWGFMFLHILINTYLSFDYIHLGGCEVAESEF